jgi:hypothetical protein
MLDSKRDTSGRVVISEMARKSIRLRIRILLKVVSTSSANSLAASDKLLLFRCSDSSMSTASSHWREPI